MEESKIINQAVKILRAGGIIIFPTDTVWGIGASINNLKALTRLYKIKKRSKLKPTAVLVSSISQAKQLGVIDQLGENIMRKYWPGGLTIIVKSKSKTLGFIQGEKETIGLRMPNHKLVLDILVKLGNGIVAASANFNGEPAPTAKELIDKKLIGLVDLVIEGESKGNLPSTIVDLTQSSLKILRKGVIVLEKIPLDK